MIRVVSPRRWTRFGRFLLAIALVALAVRITYVAWGKGGSCPTGVEDVVAPTQCPSVDPDTPNDSTYYNSAANHLARGGGLTDPFRPDEPAADHPPLTVFALAPVSWLGDRLPDSWIGDPTNQVPQRYAMALFGTAVVVGIGFAGRRLGRSGDLGGPGDRGRADRGDSVGLIAAGVAAIYPGLWISDALIFSETVTNLAVVLAILAALRAREALTTRRLVILGVACALAGLARAELLLFGPLLAAIIVPWREPKVLRRIGAVAVGAIALVGPWVVYNNLRFEEFTFVSTNDGLAIAASNCEPVYHGANIGLTSYDAAPADAAPEIKADPIYCVEIWDRDDLEMCPQRVAQCGDQSEVSKYLRDRTLRYIGNNMKWQPVVMSARVGRVWNLYRPFDMVWFNEGEDREAWATRSALFSFYPVALLAVVGGIRLRRDRRTLLALLVPIAVVTIGAAVTYGQARYRAAAEPSLVLLAAVALAWIAGRRARAGGSEEVQG